MGARVLTRLAGLLGLCGVSDAPPSVTPCEAAFTARDWRAALGACRHDPADDAQPRVRHAWAQFRLGHRDEALAEATTLIDSSEGADARYLTGLLLTRQGAPDRVERGRRLLWSALGMFALLGDPRSADVATALAQSAHDHRQLDDALRLARLAASLARATADPVRRGSALTTLAAIHGEIGRADDARAAFDAAAEALATRPAELAWVYAKHAVFLLELRTPADAGAALGFLDAAARNAELARRAGQADRLDRLDLAVSFNRAAALSVLGRDGEAVAALPAGQEAHPSFLRITGLAAARRGDARAALAYLDRPLSDRDSGDYAVSIAVALAQVCRATGRLVDAERALRRAIEHVDALRGQASLELRPWILAHRATPYAALIELLVDQGRAAEALAVLEALHARAWLDATAEPATAAPGGPAPAPTSATGPGDPAPAPSSAAAALDRAGLLARLGDREALVLSDLGPTAWRAHVLDGAVRVERVPAAAFDALEAFRGAPDQLGVAAAAAAIVLPRELSAGDRPLTIVASGRFADLPFPALRRGARPLIADRAIARLPGLAAARCPPRAAVGPPVFIGDAAGDLPRAADEVRALAAAHLAPALLGAAATRAAVVASRDARWLHLAVHGAVGPDGGAIALHDGPLSVAAVRRERLAPTVVVLAGCATAAGADLESWTGLPSAFLAAGSRFVVATTRSVPDDAAATVVHAFYGQPAALDPVARLAAAQRVVAASLPAAAWASFAAWGVTGCDPGAPPAGE